MKLTGFPFNNLIWLKRRASALHSAPDCLNFLKRLIQYLEKLCKNRFKKCIDGTKSEFKWFWIFPSLAQLRDSYWLFAFSKTASDILRQSGAGLSGKQCWWLCEKFQGRRVSRHQTPDSPSSPSQQRRPHGGHAEFLLSLQGETIQAILWSAWKRSHRQDAVPTPPLPWPQVASKLGDRGKPYTRSNVPARSVSGGGCYCL